MILYFADRQFNVLGQASTGLPEGLRVSKDKKTEEIDTGVSVFECKVHFDKSTREKVESYTTEGNYLLRNQDGENELYTIIDNELDVKGQTVYIYAEDAGMDLLNEVVGEYSADKAYSISHYINKYASDAGFVIGINEAKDLTRKLRWEGEATATERIASVATQFDGCEISYTFDIEGLSVVKKYINIYKERGKDLGITLYLNKDIDNIIITKSIANLATALQCTGGTPENEEKPITLKGYAYDDGDFYVSGNLLKSRVALKRWNRYLWKSDEEQQAGGHIVKQYSYDTVNQSTLCKHAITELKKIRDTEINYEIDIKKLPDNVKIGDRVNIVDDAGELYVSTRVLCLESSVSEQEYTATLGEHLIKSGGISQKVADLAEQFAKASQSAARALSISNTAKETAEAAQNQANVAAEGVTNAQTKAEEAKEQADNALQSATEAQTKADNAQSAVENVENSVEELNTAVENVQQAANNAHQAAQTAQNKANEADQSAKTALTKANLAKTASENAENKATEAISKAEIASGTATTAKTEAENAQATAQAAKLDAEQAKSDIENLGDSLTTLEETMTAEYSRKTELTETTANLEAKITKNASELEVVHSKVVVIDETANDAAAQAAAAYLTAEQAQREADAAQVEADNARVEANVAQTAANNAQAEADNAKRAADEAQAVVDSANADLIAAQAELESVLSRADSTEEEIALAQQAVNEAQAAADEAQQDAETAKATAQEAQRTADTAKENAVEALNNANIAAQKAVNAQKAAELASGSVAAQAQATADEAAEIAAEAQRTANTAVNNATSAQSKADEAAQAAQTAQQAADDADAKAQQAANDLITAQQNLSNVTSRVDATEEEVAAAQQAVITAQQAADKAKADAEAAQITANTAKANATTAQQAADQAQQAADNAQAEAETAKQAADNAQAAVNALAVRVTKTETDLVKTSEQIGLLATKEEVSQTLDGYYTKTEADAAILAKANAINLSVDSKVESVQVGGRNLLKNSRHITLNSNNAASYPIFHTIETENGREFRRYRRTENTLSPTTMSLYSIIPVNQITDCLTNQEITFSFLIRCSHNTTTNIMNRIVIDGVNYNFAPEETHNIGTEWQRLFVTATITQEYEVNSSNILRFNPLMIPIPSGVIDTFYIDVCEWKIEKGNKATDWSPAPEDIDDKFSNYSTTEEMHRAIELNEEGIFSTVKDTYTSKEDFNSLDVGGRNLVRDSSLKEKTDMWSFSSDNTYSFEKGYCEVYRDTTNGSRTFNSQSTNANKLLKPDNLAGGTFTLSAEIKLLDGYSITDASSLFYRCNTTELSSGFQEIAVKLGGATTEWQKVHAVFTFGDYNFDGSCQVCIALENALNVGVCIRNIKLEKGNKATDWTSAPEDAESEIDNLQDTVSGYSGFDKRIEAAESSIKQLSDAISTLVQKNVYFKVNYVNGSYIVTEEMLDPLGGNPVGVTSTGETVYLGTKQNGEEVYFCVDDKASRMVFDAEKSVWSFNTSEIDENIFHHTEDIEELKNKANGTTEDLNNVDERLRAFEEHIEISTYEDEPCIILYENDSNYKQIITNTRRIIMQTVDGVDTILSITDFESVKTKKVIATEAVQVGGYVLKELSSGAYVLDWEGVIE